MPPTSPILYHNPQNTVMVIDIPASIAAAQCSPSSQIEKHLLSTLPLQQPYPTTEPKSKAILSSFHGESSEWHAQIAREVIKALGEVRECAGLAKFCLPRCVVTDGAVRETEGAAFRSGMVTRSSRKRKADGEREASFEDLDELFRQSCESRGFPKSARVWLTSQSDDSQQGSDPMEEPALFHLDDTTTTSSDDYIHNQTLKTQFVHAKLTTPNQPPTLSFHMPPTSAFLLTPNINYPDFRTACRAFAPSDLNHRNKGRFDLILLDPPWPNRSARRKTPYRTYRTVNDTIHTLQTLQMSDHVKPGGYIALWTTNRPTIRCAALSLLDSCNADLIEEWIWLKTTSAGEPILPVDGVWRKPYEVLLVGRARRSSTDPESAGARLGGVTRRVLLGVPDKHSRKPCLKGLFARVLLGGVGGVRGVELFARYLVEGWLSVGAEAMRYNFDGHWASRGIE